MVDLLIIGQGTASSSQYGVEYGAAYGEYGKSTSFSRWITTNLAMFGDRGRSYS